MADLIERGKLLEYIDDNFYPTTVSCYMTAAEARAARERHNMFIDAINNATTVDATPVKLGKWQEKRHFHSNETSFIEVWQIMSCSKCKKYLITPYQSYLVEYKYCPNCGAKMDGGEKDG